MNLQFRTGLFTLFSTNFSRVIWLVTLSSGSIVEMAFDQGEISSDGRNVSICELELELVSGKTADLLHLAHLSCPWSTTNPYRGDLVPAI